MSQSHNAFGGHGDGPGQLNPSSSMTMTMMCSPSTNPHSQPLPPLPQSSGPVILPGTNANISKPDNAQDPGVSPTVNTCVPTAQSAPGGTSAASEIVEVAFDAKNCRTHFEEIKKHWYAALRVEPPVNVRAAFYPEIKEMLARDVHMILTPYSRRFQIDKSTKLRMYGARESDKVSLRPTILISCSSKRGMEKIRRDLNALQLTYLKDYGRPWEVYHRANSESIRWFGTSAGHYQSTSSAQTQPAFSFWIEALPAGNTFKGCSLKCLVPSEGSSEIRYSRIGGVIRLGNSWYGLSSAHTFLVDPMDLDASGDSSPVCTEGDKDSRSGSSMSISSKGDSPLDPTNWADAEIPSHGYAVPADTEYISLDCEWAYSFLGQEKSLDGERDSKDSQSDWAIFSLPEHIFQETAKGPGVIPQPNSVLAEAELESGGVLVLLSNARVVEGFLAQGITTMHTASSHIDLFEIVLDHPLPAGSSGSWVLRDVAICGYVIAGSKSGYTCFMMPMDRTLQDIERLTGLKAHVAIDITLIYRDVGEATVGIIDSKDSGMSSVDTTVASHNEADAQSEEQILKSELFQQLRSSLGRGQWSEAEKLNVQVLDLCERLHGQEHPDTLSSQANLAFIYQNQGRWDEAEKLETVVLETTKRVHGLYHPSTWTSQGNLAITYWKQGRLDEAEKLEKQVTEETSRCLGPEHPDTLSSQARLASTYRKQGRLDEAESLQSNVLERTQRVLPQEHPNVLTSRADLATTYWKQGRFHEAERLQVQVVETRKRVLGPDHFDTLNIQESLARTLRSQGRRSEALTTMKECASISSDKLGREHPDTQYRDARVQEWQNWYEVRDESKQPHWANVSSSLSSTSYSPSHAYQPQQQQSIEYLPTPPYSYDQPYQPQIRACHSVDVRDYYTTPPSYSTRPQPHPQLKEHEMFSLH